ncbi:anti-sigma factor [Limibacter armeniacum]|uniref:anti-sigma factor n=1 Tax=Limibacter armeniacum TaxID=466084 RepID=UPI002FE51B8C
MKIEDYIASGILELYVLGDLNENEMKEVEEMRKKHPAIAQEIERIEADFLHISQKNSVKAPEHIKHQILSKIKNTEGKTIPLIQSKKTGTSVWWKASVAASLLLLAVSTYFTFYYKDKYEDVQLQVDNLMAEKAVMAQRLKKASNDLSLALDPSYQRILLGGTGEQEHKQQLTVYWNPNNTKVFVSLKELPPPPEGKQYQLWAIAGKTPKDAGLIDYGQDKLLAMPSTAEADAFAVTLEPKGGSKSPTLEEMKAIGYVATNKS